MIFNKILIEEDLYNNPRVDQILEKLKRKKDESENVFQIKNYSDYFSNIKKPYLQKRENLNLFIANKKGELVKVAPDAYGTKGAPHYYYVHSYNCIYECNYCYLQGYFHSPDLVVFLNTEDIMKRMEDILKDHSEQEVWFHAGEFSDSLALSHITSEIESFYPFFKKNPNAIWELRTKSANIRGLKKMRPLKNLIVSFSLSPDESSRQNDLKTPGLKARLNAIKELYDQGHKIGLHFDPIIYHEDLESQYQELLLELSKKIPLSEIQYLSIGVVRFSKSSYQQTIQNYPEAQYLKQDFVNANDDKVKYPKPMRNWILSKIKNLCIKNGVLENAIYECMEL